jgi:hypothetical protein
MGASNIVIRTIAWASFNGSSRQKIASSALRRPSPSFADFFRPRLGFVELGAATSDVFRSQALHVAIVELPAGIRAPAQRRLYGRPRCRRVRQHLERQLERERLRFGILRPTRGIAEGKVGEKQPWHADILDDVLGAAHDDGGDAALLERAGGKAHGLMAHGTVGNQDRRIDDVRFAARDDLRTVDLEGSSPASVCRQAVKARSQRSDAVRRREVSQRGEREVRSGILRGRMLSIDREVRDPEIVGHGRVARIDGIELRHRVVRSTGTLIALVGLIGRGRDDERNSASIKWLGEWAERNIRVMRPFVRRAIAQRLVVLPDAPQVRDRRVIRRRETQAHANESTSLRWR